MNIFAVLIVGFLFVGGLNDKPKDSQEGKKITQVTANTVLEAKVPKKEVTKAEPQEQEPVQEVAKADPQEQEPVQEVAKDLKTDKELRSEVKELDKSEDLEINYLSLVLYIFGFIILVISIGAYIYLRQRNSSSLSSATDNARREFKEEVKSEPQEQPAEEEDKNLKTDEELDEDEKK